MRAYLARLLAGLAGLALPCFVFAQTKFDVGKFGAIAGIVQAEIAAGQVPGAVVVVGRGQDVLYAQAFGNRATEPAAEPMTLDTIFDLASLTKVVATTPAVLQLAERGLIDLETPVARYWPEFAANGKGGITIRALLSHTSGLPEGIDLREAGGSQDIRRRLAALTVKATQRGVPLYSDVNFAVLGEVVRRVSGLSLDRYAAKHLFGPLGMSDTGFNMPKALHARIAPTSRNGNGGSNGGKVHDPLAARLDGVSGNAGLFSTAMDVSRFARTLIGGGAPLLSAASVRQMFSPQTYPAVPPRGLGWKLEAPLAINRAALPPVGAASHLGYTGTGLWLDPVSDVYVVVLSNRVYANGDAGPLRARIVAAVAEALGPLAPERIAGARPELADRVAPYLAKTVGEPVQTGIDVLKAENFSSLRNLRVGLLTNRSGVDSTGMRTIDVLARASQVSLKVIFSPEHGLDAHREGRIGDDIDLRTGLPIRSLYGATLRPTAEMLNGLDAVVVDIQDVGARFFTYASTLAYLMEASGKQGIKVIVLDRPNPLNGLAVQGPLLDPERRSFTGYWPLPIRHGLTLGEFARLYRGEAGIEMALTVIPMQRYRRELWYDDTGLPWLPPSPNLTSFGATLLYPAVGMIEGAEISVGRGTPTPFEVVGAPWIDGRSLAEELNRQKIAGVDFVPTEFEPVADRHAGQHCHGVRIEVKDRSSLDLPTVGVALVAALHRLYPASFTLEKTLGAIGSQATLDAIRAGQAPLAIAAGWKASLDRFREVRNRYLLYD